MAQFVTINDGTQLNYQSNGILQNVTSGTHLEEFIAYQKIKSHIGDEGALNLRSSAVHIINCCNPHDAVGNTPSTHLVVGYVQSGKTMSFTSVMELALDCHYKIVVVLAGITNNLLEQTSKRLGTDLICGNAGNHRHFKIHVNPEVEDASKILRNLKLSDSIIIIPVLKHYDRINRLTQIFETPEFKNLLSRETALIIDDEADQASLNNYARSSSATKNQSETYAAIVNMRAALPANSYIQYTATPQANVLISALDLLSPKTHTLLKPGKGYCGGKLFFGVPPEGLRFGKKLIKQIPPQEVFHSKKSPLTAMPQSLKNALILHTWAVIIVTRLYHSKDIAQLSMMVHTDVKLVWNATFRTWIQEELDRWSNALEKPDGTLMKQGLYNEFKVLFSEASSLYDQDPNLTFDNLKQYIPEVINDTEVYLITGETDDVKNLEWEQHCSNILVGAQMLNRGFTVDYLTTTYMPRYSVSVTNADTIEQRCRFFGYKEKYIRSCRVFLPQKSIDDYENYIDMEEELRNMLEHTATMKECGHKILSVPKLRPTRTNVLPKSVVTQSLCGMKTFSPYRAYTLQNLYLVDSLIEKKKDQTQPLSVNRYEYSNYSGYRCHTCFKLTVDETIDFLENFQLTNREDILRKADTMRYLQYLKESGKISILVVNMSEGLYKERDLELSTYEMTSNPFNGPSSGREINAVYYPGDKAMIASDTVTLQLHHFEFKNQSNLRVASISVNCPKSLQATYTSSI